MPVKFIEIYWPYFPEDYAKQDIHSINPGFAQAHCDLVVGSSAVVYENKLSCSILDIIAIANSLVDPITEVS